MLSLLALFSFFFYVYGDHLDRHVLTHSFPTRRSSDLASGRGDRNHFPDRGSPMRLSRFFIDRPIFAAVLAVIITIVGAVASLGLPVSPYPDIVPPTVTVAASYPGPSAETDAATVAAPIEQAIHGIHEMALGKTAR